MKGKVLGLGVISGDDGNRYEFDVAEVQNLNNANPQTLVGKQVDFIPNGGGGATKIFIVGGNIATPDINALTDKLKSDDLSSIKLKYYISLGAGFLSTIPVLGALLGIVSFVTKIMAINSLKRASQSQTLLLNYVLQLVLMLIGGFVIGFSALMVFFTGTGLGQNPIVGLAGASITTIIVGFLFFIANALYSHKFYSEMAQITDQNLFKITFWLYLCGLFTLPFFIGAFLILVAIIIEIIAWVKISNINPSNNTYKLF